MGNVLVLENDTRAHIPGPRSGGSGSHSFNIRASLLSGEGRSGRDLLKHPDHGVLVLKPCLTNFMSRLEPLVQRVLFILVELNNTPSGILPVGHPDRYLRSARKFILLTALR